MLLSSPSRLGTAARTAGFPAQGWAAGRGTHTRHMLPTPIPHSHTSAMPSAQTECTIGLPVALIASRYSAQVASSTAPPQASTSIRSAPQLCTAQRFGFQPLAASSELGVGAYGEEGHVLLHVPGAADALAAAVQHGRFWTAPKRLSARKGWAHQVSVPMSV